MSASQAPVIYAVGIGRLHRLRVAITDFRSAYLYSSWLPSLYWLLIWGLSVALPFICSASQAHTVFIASSSTVRLCLLVRRQVDLWQDWTALEAYVTAPGRCNGCEILRPTRY